MRSNKTEATARWPQWTPGRVLAAAVIVVVSCAAGFVLVVVGSVRATEYVNSPLPTAPGDKLRGAVEFVLGALLVVAGPGIVAILRRTVVLKWIVSVIAVLVGAYVVYALATWPPESDWTVY